MRLPTVGIPASLLKPSAGQIDRERDAVAFVMPLNALAEAPTLDVVDDAEDRRRRRWWLLGVLVTYLQQQQRGKGRHEAASNEQFALAPQHAAVPDPGT
eukprot:scaffold578_cov243-Pinguiococcus_pyrenoidosus.AAC.5